MLFFFFFKYAVSFVRLKFVLRLLTEYVCLCVSIILNICYIMYIYICRYIYSYAFYRNMIIIKMFTENRELQER